MTDPLFGTYFSRNYTQGELIEIDDQLKLLGSALGGWIHWKNHRLIQLGFYEDRDPPMKRRHGNIDDTPPRLILREDSHQNTNVPAISGFLSKGHLEFKVYLL